MGWDFVFFREVLMEEQELSEVIGGSHSSELNGQNCESFGWISLKIGIIEVK
jgi:hypothetical protein